MKSRSILLIFSFVLNVLFLCSYLPQAFAAKVDEEQARAAYVFFDLEFETPLQVVKKRYRKLISKVHPDKHGPTENHAIAQEINIAYAHITEWMKQKSNVNISKSEQHPETSLHIDSLAKINSDAYLKLLSFSKYFNPQLKSVAENSGALFELIYRLYNLGYSQDVLASLKAMNLRLGSGQFEFEAAFKNLFGLFGDRGTQLQSHFQLFQTRDINAYLNYSHILVHFDAPLTQATGFPRFRIFMINPNTDSADEMLAIFRNHNNDHPRLQVFQRQRAEDLYIVERDGSRSLLKPAHDRIVSLDLSILDINGHTPFLVDLLTNTNSSLTDTNKLNALDLGLYLTSYGIRFIRPGFESHSNYQNFDQTYVEVKPDQVLKTLEAFKILEKVQNANAHNFSWPQPLAPISFTQLPAGSYQNRNGIEDQSPPDSQGECDTVLANRVLTDLLGRLRSSN
ncbi:MAG: J domain-containing protein [Bdellovibrionaceae bacterium]|nr:J domain-containing protein [Pseudobdellovibrionaceae bacterium]